jgi:(p)ppGpp synthase/HD superfamily hydrolase
MTLDERQNNLFKLVQEWHGDQKRKYINTPYWEHPYRVAEIASAKEPAFGTIEVALCHDVLEDTSIDHVGLFEALLDVGYSKSEAHSILLRVRELTDVYTSEDYPEFNRSNRKRMERQRLSMISPAAQSVKYADFIDNISSIAEHDPDFARTYIREKKELLNVMRQGDIDLLIEACVAIHLAEQTMYDNATSPNV